MMSNEFTDFLQWLGLLSLTAATAYLYVENAVIKKIRRNQITLSNELYELKNQTAPPVPAQAQAD